MWAKGTVESWLFLWEEQLEYLTLLQFVWPHNQRPDHDPRCLDYHSSEAKLQRFVHRARQTRTRKSASWHFLIHLCSGLPLTNICLLFIFSLKSVLTTHCMWVTVIAAAWVFIKTCHTHAHTLLSQWRLQWPLIFIKAGMHHLTISN